MPSACNIRPLFASMKQGSNPVNVKPKEYTRSRASGMSMPPSYNGQEGQFELHADAMVIYG